jgi:hypothetical protein
MTDSCRHPLQMPQLQPINYIKGFKLDEKKIRDHFARDSKDSDSDPDPDLEFKWFDFIINCIPRDAYIRIEGGMEPDDSIACVLVLDQGNDREALEKDAVKTDNEVLAQIAKDVLTAGVWTSF